MSNRKNLSKIEKKLMSRRSALAILGGTSFLTACNFYIPGSNISIPTISDIAGPVVEEEGGQEIKEEERIFLATPEHKGQSAFISSSEPDMNSKASYPEILRLSTPQIPQGFYGGESTLVQFDLRKDFSGASVDYNSFSIYRAHLILTLFDRQELQQGTSIHKVSYVGLSAPWDQQSLTFNNSGKILNPSGHNSTWASESYAEKGLDQMIAFNLFDLTHANGGKLVNHWVDTPKENHGLLLRSVGTGGTLRTYHKTRLPPMLVLGLRNFESI